MTEVKYVRPIPLFQFRLVALCVDLFYHNPIISDKVLIAFKVPESNTVSPGLSSKSIISETKYLQHFLSTAKWIVFHILSICLCSLVVSDPPFRLISQDGF